jgi:hypothetical protein
VGSLFAPICRQNADQWNDLGKSRNIYRNLHTFDQTQEVVFAIRGVIDVEEREYRSPSES